MFEENPVFVISVFTRVPSLSILGDLCWLHFVITGAKYLTKINRFIVPSVERCSPLQREERCHRGCQESGRLSHCTTVRKQREMNAVLSSLSACGMTLPTFTVVDSRSSLHKRAQRFIS